MKKIIVAISFFTLSLSTSAFAISAIPAPNTQHEVTESPKKILPYSADTIFNRNKYKEILAKLSNSELRYETLEYYYSNKDEKCQEYHLVELNNEIHNLQVILNANTNSSFITHRALDILEKYQNLLVNIEKTMKKETE